MSWLLLCDRLRVAVVVVRSFILRHAFPVRINTPFGASGLEDGRLKAYHRFGDLSQDIKEKVKPGPQLQNTHKV